MPIIPTVQTFCEPQRSKVPFVEKSRNQIASEDNQVPVAKAKDGLFPVVWGRWQGAADGQTAVVTPPCRALFGAPKCG